MKTATNPETGETVQWDGKAWVPLTTATNPETGETAVLVGNSWQVQKSPVADFAQSAQELPGKLGDITEQLFGDITSGDAARLLPKGQEDPNASFMETYNPVSAVANVAGAGLEAMGEIGSTGMKAWNASYGQLIPESAKRALINSGPVQAGIEAIEQGMEAWHDFSTDYPMEAAALEDVGLLAELGVPRFRPSEAALKRGEVYNRTAYTEQTIEAERSALANMVRRPDSQGRITEEGPFRKAKWTPDTEETYMVDALSTVKKINPDRSYHYNYDVVDQEINKLTDQATAYAKQYKKNRLQVDNIFEALGERIDNIEEYVPNYYLLPGDAQKASAAMFDDIRDRIAEVSKKGSVTPAQLLQIRRDFDRAAENSGINLGPEGTSARTIAQRQIRTVLNDMVKAATPGHTLHDLLDRSHELINARTVMRPKRDAEGTNVFSRFWQLTKDSPVRPPVTPLGIMSTAGAGAAVGPSVITGAVGGAGVGWALAQTYHTLKGPAKRKFLADMLGEINRAGKSNPEILKDFATERVILLEMIKSTGTQDDG